MYASAHLPGSGTCPTEVKSGAGRADTKPDARGGTTQAAFAASAMTASRTAGAVAEVQERELRLTMRG